MTEVTTVTGPYGSGKTTLLNSLMRVIKGRTLVVVNDVGETNVDATRLSKVAEVQSIAAGCMGCNNLNQFLQIAREAIDYGVDHLVVEPTGAVDGREVRDAVAQLGLSWRCICLVNTRDFEEDVADGILESQVRVATSIGLTHLGSIREITDPHLASVFLYIGEKNPGVPIQLVLDPEEQKLSNAVLHAFLGTSHSVEQEKDHGDHNDHLEHHEHQHGQTHAHGSYAISFSLGNDVTLLDIVNALTASEQVGLPLLRAKGVVTDANGTKREFDVVRQDFRLGDASNLEPYGVFISRHDLPKVITNLQSAPQHFTLTKGQLLGGPQDVDATIRSMRRWMDRFPPAVREDGSIRVRCDAGMLFELAFREGIPADIAGEGVWRYCQWILEGVAGLPNATQLFDPQVVGGWKFVQGKALGWLATNAAPMLGYERAAYLWQQKPVTLLCEGLLAQNEQIVQDTLTWADIAPWPMPSKKAYEILANGLAQEPGLQKTDVLAALQHAADLVKRLGSEENAQLWQDLLNRF